MNRDPKTGRLIDWTAEEREEHGKRQYALACARDLMGWIKPTWNELTDEQREGWRDYAVRTSI